MRRQTLWRPAATENDGGGCSASANNSAADQRREIEEHVVRLADAVRE